MAGVLLPRILQSLLALSICRAFAACGEAASVVQDDAGAQGDSTTDAAGDSAVASETAGPDIVSPRDAGSDEGASSLPDAPSDGAAACACDAGGQYCMHGDLTTNGARDVYRCEPRVGDCFDCSCYLQIGLCLESGLPRACTVKSGLIMVECAEIP
jgi:hypothetical protein